MNTNPSREDRPMTATATPTTIRTDVLVIGAGQAGLAAGYHLHQRGIDYRIVEADDRIGDVWRKRYDSLLLFTPAGYDALPGMPFPLPKHVFPTGRQMADYLEAYASQLGLNVDTGVSIERLEQPAGGAQPFVAIAGDRRYEASQVIVATGTFQRPRVPALAADLDPRIRQLHSSEYRNPAQLADGPTLVVGLSHSGSDIAHEIASTHKVIVSGRAHGQLPVPIDSRRGRLGFHVVAAFARHVATLNTPIGRKMAIEIKKGGGPLLRWRKPELLAAGVELTDARTTGVQDGKPVLADGRVLDVANVIWSTGFRSDYSWISPPLQVDELGAPEQYRGVSAVRGLYFMGVVFQYSFASMNVYGVGRDARYVVDRVAELRGSRTTIAVSPERSLV
jgi:putative flavoprotein involved in K+ transport